jgi:hypothetical protein
MAAAKIRNEAVIEVFSRVAAENETRFPNREGVYVFRWIVERCVRITLQHRADVEPVGGVARLYG